jgi:hypothetical protein
MYREELIALSGAAELVNRQGNAPESLVFVSASNCRPDYWRITIKLLQAEIPMDLLEICCCSEDTNKYCTSLLLEA